MDFHVSATSGVLGRDRFNDCSQTLNISTREKCEDVMVNMSAVVRGDDKAIPTPSSFRCKVTLQIK